MFSVLFEVQPQPQQWDAYCADANMRRPELAQLPGFVHAVLYRSLARNGWLLSVSGWRDSASVAGWPERIGNDEADERDPDRILDYRLRVGEVTSDTRVAVGSTSSSTERTGPGPGRALM